MNEKVEHKELEYVIKEKAYIKEKEEAERIRYGVIAYPLKKFCEISIKKGAALK